MVDILETLPTGLRTESLRSVLDNSSLGFFVVNIDGLIEYLNGEAARIIGFDENDNVSECSLQDIESVINGGLMGAFASVLDGGTFRKYEHRCTNRRGHFAVLNLFCSPYRGDDGKAVGALGIIQDITDSFRQKAELEEVNCELSIMGQVSEALSTTDTLDKILKIILTGVTANQGLGFNRAFLFLANEEEQMLEGKIAVGPRNPEEAGQVWARLAGQQQTLTELLNDYLEREGNSSFTLSSLISDWKMPLESTSIFSQVVKEARGINVFADSGLSPESEEILRRLDTRNLAVAPIISKGRRLGLIAADNQITGKAIVDSDLQLLQTFANQSAVAIERSQLHDKLVEHAARLEEKNRQLADSQEQMIRVEKMSVIGELTSSIAHELRNPLTVIGGFANLMLTAGGNDANSEYLNIILSEAKRAEVVLHQVLDFSRASRTGAREIDVNLLVSQTHELLLSRICCHLKPPALSLSDQKLTVWGNPDQLQHALYQFMDLTLEELTGECTVEFSTELIDNIVRLTIGFSCSDSGRARVAETLKLFFGSSTGNQKLSMIVAGETIKYHGGSFGVEGTAENMPKIYIELPQKSGGESV